MDEFTEAQKKFMHDLFANLNITIKENTSEIRTEIQIHITDIKEEIASTINVLNNKVGKLEKENQSLRKNILFLERKVRKNNLIIFGIDRNVPVLNNVIKLFNEILEVPVTENDINDCYRLNSNKNNKIPPVVVEFTSLQRKLAVLSNAKKLKGKNISIAKDLCQQDRETNKLLLKHQKEARSVGKTAFIRGDKLVVENDTYTIDQLGTEDTEVLVDDISEKIDSAPPTPNPATRQKRLLHELGIEGEDKQEPKKAKPCTSKAFDENIPKIQTRSNAATKK